MIIEHPRIFNVKEQYDAVGNGIADDTTAIYNASKAACRAGGIVFYPAGTYKISDTIRVWSENKVFHLGEGTSQTIIKASPTRKHKGGSEKPTAFNMFAVGPAPGAHVFADMTIDGSRDFFSMDKAENVGYGIYFSCPKNPSLGNVVRNVHFINHHICAVTSFGDNNYKDRGELMLPHEIWVESCTFESIGERAVFLRYSSGGGVRDCQIDFTGGSEAAITFLGCKDFTIARNIIEFGNVGIVVGLSDNYSIVLNTVKHSDAFGIVASGGLSLGLHPPAAPMSRRFICAHNNTVKTEWQGIVVDPQYCNKIDPEHDCDTINSTPVEQWGIIAHNTVDTAKQNNGISIQQSKCVLINGNTVTKADINGISLNNSSYCTVVGNTIRKAGNCGVGINGTDFSPVGFHYIGDDNVVSDQQRADFQVPEDLIHEAIRYPPHITAPDRLAVGEKPIGATIYEVVDGSYLIVDDGRMWLCLKRADGSYDWEVIHMATVP